MRLTQQQLINYLVDCKGYGELDANDMTFNELDDIDKRECILFNE